MDLYSGPIYDIHSQYAFLLNTVYVTFMFGLAMPLLFPIAFLTFLIFYFTERLLVTYFYQKPLMYDENLHMSAIKFLKWAPFVMLVFGVWIMGNQQIFENIVNPVINVSQPIVT